MFVYKADCGAKWQVSLTCFRGGVRQKLSESSARPAGTTADQHGGDEG